MSDASTLVHSVSTAEFDIKVGVTLSHVYPEAALDGAAFDKGELASLCLPDGGHKRAEDWTYLRLKDGEGGDLFGLSFFRNVPDETVARGAVQVAMLLLLRKPFFLLFKPLIREALNRLMGSDEHELTVLRAVYDALFEGLHRSVQIAVFNKHFLLNIPPLDLDPLPGASVLHLVAAFDEGVITLWRAAMLGKRILFIAETGDACGQCCLAVPAIVLPLRGVERCLVPYVQLTDLAALESDTYVAGTTNPVMADMASLYDVVAFVEAGEIRTTDEGDATLKKVTRDDRRLVKKLRNHKDEKWARRQFRVHTEQVLRAPWAPVRDSPYYAAFVEAEAKQQAAPDPFERGAESEGVRAFRALRDALETEGTTAVQVLKHYYALDKALKESVEDIGTVCSEGGVGVVGRALEQAHSSPQTRKYAIQILATLATDVAGQSDVIELRLLPVIGGLLEDHGHVNVVQAASVCLQKVSALYIGAVALVHDGVVPQLCACMEQASSDATRYTNLATLMQIFRFVPHAAHPPVKVTTLLSSEDPTFVDLLTELLDAWGEDIPYDKRFGDKQLEQLNRRPSQHRSSVLAHESIGFEAADASESCLQADAQIVRCVSALRGFDSTQPAAVESVQSVLDVLSRRLKQKKTYAIQAAHLGLLECLLKRGLLDPVLDGMFVVWELVARVAHTNTGLKRLMRSEEILQTALTALTESEHPSLTLLYIACFLEAVLQQTPVAEAVLELRGDARLLAFVAARCGNEHANADYLFLSLPLLRSLRYMFKALGSDGRETMRTRIKASNVHLLVDPNVFMEDRDRLDFMAVLASLLGSAGVLERSFVDWFVYAKEQQQLELNKKPAEVVGDTLKEGTLEKKMDWRPVWKSRVFKLTPDALVYYKPKKKTGGMEKAGMILLQDAVVNHITANSFSVRARKTFYLRTETPEETTEWVAALRRAQNKDGSGGSTNVDDLPSLQQQSSNASSGGASSISVFSDDIRADSALRRLGRQHNLSSTSQLDLAAVSTSQSNLAAVAEDEKQSGDTEEEEADSHVFTDTIRGCQQLRRISSFGGEGGPWDVFGDPDDRRRSQMLHKAQYGNRHTRTDSWTFPTT